MKRIRYKTHAKEMATLLLLFTGFLFVLSRKNRNRVRILTYHRVNDDADDFLSISVRDFECHMGYLAKHYNVIPIEGLNTFLESGSEENGVVITFDDGYKDNYTNAFPILKKYNLTATVFLTYDYIGTNKVFPWYHSKVQSEETIMLNWQETEEMANHNITFGAHTLTHPILTQIPPEECEREVLESKKKMIGKKGFFNVFAYPRGMAQDFDETVRKTVANAGFNFAFTTLHGTVGKTSDALLLKRSAVEREDSSLFMFKQLLQGSSDIIMTALRHSAFAVGIKKILKGNLP